MAVKQWMERGRQGEVRVDRTGQAMCVTLLVTMAITSSKHRVKMLQTAKKPGIKKGPLGKSASNARSILFHSSSAILVQSVGGKNSTACVGGDGKGILDYDGDKAKGELSVNMAHMATLGGLAAAMAISPTFPPPSPSNE